MLVINQNVRIYISSPLTALHAATERLLSNSIPYYYLLPIIGGSDQAALTNSHNCISLTAGPSPPLIHKLCVFSGKNSHIMANSSCVIVNIRETIRYYLGQVLPLSLGSILKCVIPHNFVDTARQSTVNTHNIDRGDWLSCLSCLSCLSPDPPARDQQNSPHYRLEIKCEGRLSVWTGDWRLD